MMSTKREHPQVRIKLLFSPEDNHVVVKTPDVDKKKGLVLLGMQMY